MANEKAGKNKKLKIGLEIHGYLITAEKLFCDCKNAHKEKTSTPNTHICPICTGQPGSKPMLPNAEAIKKLIQIALMLNCKVNSDKPLTWWRKHYDWPDLPKGFQNTISGTYATPVGENGSFLGIGITEVHLEEDPAAWNPDKGTIDYNRSGAPLVEIVTDPDFKSASEVETWLRQLLLTLSYIKALDKDSGIKADVNVSLGGERVEVKNVNSISEIVKVIIHEAERQKTQPATNQETRAWLGDKTVKTREKEQQADYRFIKEPDLPVIKLSKQEVEKIKVSLPESPMEKLAKIIKKHKISEYDANVLTQNLEIVEFFEQVINKVPAKIAVPWVTTELLGTLNHNKLTLDQVNINPSHFIQLLQLIEQGKLTKLKALDILRSWIPKSSPIKAEAAAAISDTNKIEKIVDKVLADKGNNKAVEDYKAGNEKTINFLIGQVMKLSNKRADYITAKKLLEKKLKNNS
jgi:aspartyl-tRNA(Asn)/glutamyl-tRNA(Gln) amidotransferase subunit B